MEIGDIFLLASELSERDTLRCDTIEILLYIFIYWRESEASETLLIGERAKRAIHYQG